jgi:hypothetical protein
MLPRRESAWAELGGFGGEYHETNAATAGYEQNKQYPPTREIWGIA